MIGNTASKVSRRAFHYDFGTSFRYVVMAAMISGD